VTVHDRDLYDELVRLRRSLHADPEIGLQLPRTQEKVLGSLAPLDLELSLGRSSTSITAVLRGGSPGPAVLLRGDMDALPLKENTGLSFTSRGPAMHACGHDLHTAMLVGAAHLLHARRSELAGDVIFMFQPGEEGYNGAGHMIKEGVLTAAVTARSLRTPCMCNPASYPAASSGRDPVRSWRPQTPCA
jgi:amidohydrolase